MFYNDLANRAGSYRRALQLISPKPGRCPWPVLPSRQSSFSYTPPKYQRFIRTQKAASTSMLPIMFTCS